MFALPRKTWEAWESPRSKTQIKPSYVNGCGDILLSLTLCGKGVSKPNIQKDTKKISQWKKIVTMLMLLSRLSKNGRIGFNQKSNGLSMMVLSYHFGIETSVMTSLYLIRPQDSMLYQTYTMLQLRKCWTKSLMIGTSSQEDPLMIESTSYSSL